MATPLYISKTNHNNENDNDTSIVPSNPTLAILAGYGVTIWECRLDGDGQAHGDPGAGPVTRHPHGDLPISTLAWNHNRMVIATASDVATDELDHPNIVLTSFQTGHQLDSFRHDQQWDNRPAGVANSIHFGGKSRYLCVGDESGAVCLWDLKKKVRVRQFFHDEFPSRQVALDPTDTYVLSLSPQALSVYNLRDGKLLGRVAPAGQSLFTRFHVSPLEPKVAAVGTNDGSVLLYDITTPDRSSPFFGLMRRHSGAVTGVVFSPKNPSLLVSCGEDGTVMVFDTKTGETVQQLCALPVPINSISLHSDGTTCAVGCESGEVSVYDLHRQEFGAAPLMSLRVDGPVKQIQFAPPLRAKDQQLLLRPGASAGNGGADHYSDHYDSAGATLMGLAATAPTPAKFKVPPSASSSSSNNGVVVNNHTGSGHATITLQTSSTPTAYGALQTNAGPRGSESNEVHHHQEHGVTTSSTSNPEHTRMNQPLVSSPTRYASTRLAAHTNSSSFPQQQPANETLSPKQRAATTAMQQNNTQQTTAKRAGLSPSARTIMSRGIRAPPTKTGSPTKVGSPIKTTSPTKAANQSNSGGPSGINVAQVRDVVREEVEGLQDEMEEQLRNLHMDMISQFHQQSQEFNAALSRHMSTMEQLTGENQRLREENERRRRGEG